jgi:hypothetical protein
LGSLRGLLRRAQRKERRPTSWVPADVTTIDPRRKRCVCLQHHRSGLLKSNKMKFHTRLLPIHCQLKPGLYSLRAVEARHTDAIAGNRLAVNDACRGRCRRKSSTISGKAVDEVAARAPAEVDPLAAFPSVGAECVMLVLCSQSAPWAVGRFGRQAARDEAGDWGTTLACLKFVI